MTEPLESDRIVLSAPLSYAGSRKRIWAITRRDGAHIPLVTVAAILIAFAWILVTAWYLVSLVLLGLITVPYRIIRRGQRRDRRQQQQHRELLDEVRRRG